MKQSSKQSGLRFYVSIDVGGTAIKYGILDEGGAFIKKASCPTEAKEGGKRILSQLIEIVENAGQSIAEINSQGMLSGICISTAGMVDWEPRSKRHWKINFMFHVPWKTMSIVQDLPNW